MNLDLGLMTFDLQAVAGHARRAEEIAGGVADGLHIHSFHSARCLRECVHPAAQEGLMRSGCSRSSATRPWITSR